MTRHIIKEGVLAGVIAGIVFFVLAMIMVTFLLGAAPWQPPRLIASILLGREALDPSATFDPVFLFVALLLHFALSGLYGLVLVYFVRHVKKGPAFVIGLAYGAVLYFINFYVFAELFFPWFSEARNWVTVFTHLVFGGTVGYLIKVLQGQYEENCITC